MSSSSYQPDERGYAHDDERGPIPPTETIVWDSRRFRRNWRLYLYGGIVFAVVSLLSVVFFFMAGLGLYFAALGWYFKNASDYVFTESGVYELTGGGEGSTFHPWEDVHQIQAGREYYERYLTRRGHIFFATGEMRRGHRIRDVKNPEEVLARVGAHASDSPQN